MLFHVISFITKMWSQNAPKLYLVLSVFVLLAIILFLHDTLAALIMP